MLKPIQFSSFDAAGLQACGEALKRHLLARRLELDAMRRPTRSWTECILQWFKEAAPPGVTTYSRMNNGEFMLDLAFATWSTERWELALEKPCRLRLALESEWGVAGNERETTSMILDDAAKIASVRADVKVMVFGSCSARGHRDSIVTMLSRLRDQAGDDAPWLWLDVPWWRASDGDWMPASGLFPPGRS